MLSLTAVVAAPAWILAHSEHLARPPGTRWWNHLPGRQPTPRRGSSRILLHHRTDLDAGGSLAPDALTNGPSLYLGRRPTPTAAPKWGRLTPSHWATSRDSVRLQPSIGDRPLIPDAVPAPARRRPRERRPGTRLSADPVTVGADTRRKNSGRACCTGPRAVPRRRQQAASHRTYGRRTCGSTGNRPRGEAVSHSWPGIKPSARGSRIASRCFTCFMEIWVSSLAGVLWCTCRGPY
jgi:hypothetical protein